MRRQAAVGAGGRGTMRRRLSYANVLATLAFFFALTGGAIAAGAKYLSASDPITQGDLAGSTYGSPVIANGKVTTGKIADGAVSNTKLANSSLSVNTGTGLTGGGSVALGGSTSVGLATGGVNTAQIATGAVTPAKISGIPSARARSTTSQSIPTQTVTNLFTTVALADEDYDFGNLHDKATNTNRLTAPTTGVYAISATVGWGFGGTDCGCIYERTARLQPHGAPLVAANEMTVYRSGGFSPSLQNLAGQTCLVSGDYIEVEVFQNSGVDDQLTDAHLEMTLVAPESSC